MNPETQTSQPRAVETVETLCGYLPLAGVTLATADAEYTATLDALLARADADVSQALAVRSESKDHRDKEHQHTPP